MTTNQYLWYKKNREKHFSPVNKTESKVKLKIEIRIQILQIFFFK